MAIKKKNSQTEGGEANICVCSEGLCVWGGRGLRQDTWCYRQTGGEICRLVSRCRTLSHARHESYKAEEMMIGCGGALKG